MRLAACDDDGAAFGRQEVREGSFARAVEMRFAHDPTRVTRQRRDCRPEPFRILLRRQHRDIEQAAASASRVALFTTASPSAIAGMSRCWKSTRSSVQSVAARIIPVLRLKN